MNNMRYCLSIGEDETGALVCSPLGGLIVYYNMEDACEAAKALVNGGRVPGCFVHKLPVVAFYMGIVLDADNTYADETIVHEERTDPDALPKGSN